jgi:hypothetical protein
MKINLGNTLQNSRCVNFDSYVEKNKKRKKEEIYINNKKIKKSFLL